MLEKSKSKDNFRLPKSGTGSNGNNQTIWNFLCLHLAGFHCLSVVIRLTLLTRPVRWQNAPENSSLWSDIS